MASMAMTNGPNNVSVVLTDVGGGTAEQLVRHWAVGEALHRLIVAVLQNTLQLTAPDNHILVCPPRGKTLTCSERRERERERERV